MNPQQIQAIRKRFLKATPSPLYKTDLMRKRDQAMGNARVYALKGDLKLVEKWMLVASSFYPVSDIQAWKIKKEVGQENYERMNIPCHLKLYV